MRVRKNVDGRWITYFSYPEQQRGRWVKYHGRPTQQLAFDWAEGDFEIIRTQNGHTFMKLEGDSLLYPIGEFERLSQPSGDGRDLYALTPSEERDTHGSAAEEPMINPNSSNLIDRFLFGELRGYSEEIQDFVQDGLADRAISSRSCRLFIMSEALGLILHALTANLMFFRKAPSRSQK